MRSALTRLFNAVRDEALEACGRPVRLAAWARDEAAHLHIDLNAAPPSISLEHSVTRWHDFGVTPALKWPRHAAGTVRGWRQGSDGHFTSFLEHLPALDQVAQRVKTPAWSCDIADVHGFAASKSELHRFQSTDEMVETNSKPMINAISEAKLQENLAHDEIRIIHQPVGSSDFFVRHAWDAGKRVFLVNSGGSHRFAAAKYIAKRLGRRVPLTGDLCTYRLDEAAVQALTGTYEMFVVPDDSEVMNTLHDAMKSLRATWLWHHMPRPLAHARAVLLPKIEIRSARVASALRSCGVTDLGRHLRDLLNTQRETDGMLSVLSPAL